MCWAWAWGGCLHGVGHGVGQGVGQGGWAGGAGRGVPAASQACIPARGRGGHGSSPFPAGHDHGGSAAARLSCGQRCLVGCCSSMADGGCRASRSLHTGTVATARKRRWAASGRDPATLYPVLPTMRMFGAGSKRSVILVTSVNVTHAHMRYIYEPVSGVGAYVDRQHVTARHFRSKMPQAFVVPCPPTKRVTGGVTEPLQNPGVWAMPNAAKTWLLTLECGSFYERP